jgi:hypothetical protein
MPLEDPPTGRDGTTPPRRRVLAALGLITGCTLAFQVVFTRLLSSVLAYHFSFLAISLALVGTGAGALLIYCRPSWFERRSLEVTLAQWSVLYAALLIASAFALVHLDYSLGRNVSPGFALNLGAACVLAAAPSLAAGAVVALAIRGYTPWVGRVYAWDLIGAGIGAVIVIPLLRFPAPNVIVGLGVVAAVTAVLFAWRDTFWRRWSGVAAGVGAAALSIAAVTSILYLPSGHGSASNRVADVWNPLSRVEGYVSPDRHGGVVYYDRVFAPVPGVHNGVLPTWETMGLGPQSIGYALTGPGRALVIGGGGGRDIYNALTSGQRVDVIELNNSIRDVVDNNLKSISGSPYSRRGVSTTIGDGRAILAQRDTKYNQIHIGFTDTLSGNAAQGFALTENNLYTVEAFDQYLDHLAPKGILNVSRLEKFVGDESMRATVLTMAALQRHGVKDPSRNMVVIRGTDLFASPYETILARLEPYTPTELATIRRLADQRGRGVAFAPGGPYHGPWKDLAKAKNWQDFCNNYPLNVCPPTDNKPFFFNMRRLTQIGGSQTGYNYGVDPYDLLLVTFAILLGLSILGLVLPLRLSRSPQRPTLTSLWYFAAIGLGYLILEIVLIQRFVLFLGFPTYALSVVLFALLLFTGLGSALSGRVGHTRRSLTTVLAMSITLITVSAFTLQPVLRGLIGLPFAVRVAVTIFVLAPFGVGLGMPMPIGLTRFAALHPAGVPFAWGVNGIASVLASVLGVAIAIDFGFVTASLVAAACYLGALLHAGIGRWAGADEERSSASLLDPWPDGAEGHPEFREQSSPPAGRS